MAYKNKDAKVKWQKTYNEKNKEKIRASQKSWLEKNPEKKKLYQRKSDIKSNYGISLDDYNKLFIQQKGKCAICLKHQSNFKQSLAVDHCHSSGKVRALLCANCNTALGLIKEDPQTLQRMTMYTLLHK